MIREESIRWLAAILSVDVAGYSRLMNDDNSSAPCFAVANRGTGSAAGARPERVLLSPSVDRTEGLR